MTKDLAKTIRKRARKLSGFISRRMDKYGDMRACECGHEGAMERSEEFSARSVVELEDKIIELVVEALEGKL